MNEKDKLLKALITLTGDFVYFKGAEYYEAICRYIVQELDLDIAYIGEFDKESDTIQVLSGYSQNGAIESFSYSLENSPAQSVIKLDSAIYTTDIKNSFPKNNLLMELDIDGYIGVSLLDSSKEPIGLLAVLSKKKIEDGEFILRFLKLFTKSLAAEMQRVEHTYNAANLKNLAYFDPLTKLPNRLLLTDRLERAILNSKRQHKMVAVCLMDLDGFKDVNDTLGHDAGDFILTNVSRRIEKILRSEDTIGRLGGDEFVIILTDISNSEAAAKVLHRILKTVSDIYRYKDKEITTISASIGVSLYPDDNSDEEILIRHADQAMYKAKESGKNQFYFFDLKEHSKVKANFRALKKIEKAIENSEFELYFQPKLSSYNLKIESAEVLTRWNHPILGTLSPLEFLPLIENDELIFKFDSWVIKESLISLKKLKQNDINIKLSINISSTQFKQQDFVQKVKDIANEIKIDYSYFKYIEFEITESSALESVNHTNKIIKELKTLGITIALDDFGTGYSSLTHLKELHIDCIKIDKNFVLDMLHNSQDMAIVNAVISLSKVFQIDVVAEGVENVEHLFILFELGADQIQGYSISRPLNYDNFINYIIKYKPDPKWTISLHNIPQRGDFELLIAQSNHKYWIDLTIESLSKKEFNNLPALSHESCRLGKWIATKGKRYFSQFMRFNDLIYIHRKIHEEILVIIEELKRMDKTISKAEIDKIMELKNQFMLAIEQLREEYRINKLSKGIKWKQMKK